MKHALIASVLLAAAASPAFASHIQGATGWEDAAWPEEPCKDFNTVHELEWCGVQFDDTIGIILELEGSGVLDGNFDRRFEEVFYEGQACGGYNTALRNYSGLVTQTGYGMIDENGHLKVSGVAATDEIKAAFAAKMEGLSACFAGVAELLAGYEQPAARNRSEQAAQISVWAGSFKDHPGLK